ncbi:hypothetical protein L2E82_29295 [Cichorium intybus]|uniref:Uncharacterized protein n=1 Tax=Cichorium intybus TaxID=13427 RepID=A0ACB9CXD9_CICIN|nr:hypothetical protein L2E82_29295 [Cichorium intybus]
MQILELQGPILQILVLQGPVLQILELQGPVLQLLEPQGPVLQMLQYRYSVVFSGETPVLQCRLLRRLRRYSVVFSGYLVGVCNGRVAVPNSLPSEEATVNLYKQNRITAMRIYDPNAATLRALNGTDIELMVDVPNRELESLNNLDAARTWVQNNILYYHPGVKFRYIAVGNEVDPNSVILVNRGYVKFVLPAMRNVQQAIEDAGLDNQIKVSTATYGGLLTPMSYPPSAGEFQSNVIEEFIRDIITFLDQNNLPMLANIYPYFAASYNMDVDLQYALFRSGPLVPDGGLMYSNLFDAMLDTHYAAQARLGGSKLEIVVSESGWPSQGDPMSPSRGDLIATLDNAGTYYKNLIEHVKQ